VLCEYGTLSLTFWEEHKLKAFEKMLSSTLDPKEYEPWNKGSKKPKNNWCPRKDLAAWK
jgi:hypothetical protein